MKSLIPLLFLALIEGCSKKYVKVSPVLYMELNAQNASKHKMCLDQKKQVLNRAITQTENAELNDENYFFVRDETKALSFIEKFDLAKFVNLETQKENEAIVNACVVDKDKAYKSCDSMAAAYQYFRSIIYGLRQYSWSDSTKKIAIDQTMSYVRYTASSEPRLMDIILANDLVMRLADLGSVRGSLYSETVAFRRDAEAVHKALNKKIQKISKKKVECKDIQSFFELERREVSTLTESFLKMIER